MEKLEIKHLKGYLGTGLKVKSFDIFENDPIFTMTADRDTKRHHVNIDWVLKDEFKPILHPLSDITKEITINGKTFCPVDKLEEMYFTLDLHKQALQLVGDARWANQCDYMLIQHLFDWHFDVFELIKEGLAISVNTLPDNPYK